MRLPVVKYGDPVLRQKGEVVNVFDAELKKLSEDMLETMYDENGVGLAAQQIGKAMQFFVVDVQPKKGDKQDFKLILDGKELPANLVMPMVFANVKIELLDEDLWLCREGCLSFPGIRGEVARCENIRAEFQDIRGEKHIIECTGFLARCIQHENDHCQGVVFVDAMEKSDVLRMQTKLKILRRDTIAEIKAARKKSS